MMILIMICHRPQEEVILVNVQIAQAFAQRQGVTDTAMIIVIMQIATLTTVIVVGKTLILWFVTNACAKNEF